MATLFEEVAQVTSEKGESGFNEAGAAVLSTPAREMPLPLAETPELRAAIAETPIHLLLAVLTQLTGDETFLDQCRPHIKSIWGGGPRLPEALGRELRERLFAVLTSPMPDNAPPITEGTLVKIMTTLVGEPVGPEFVPLLIEQMGFQPTGRFVPVSHRRAPEGFKVAVIGAGLSGIAAAIKLEEAGYNYQIFEKAPEVGGVWWSTRYPGVAVDTPSHFYSYSYELNPDWPKYYSQGPVLLEYWKKVADKYDLRKKISFETEVVSCIWDDAKKRWSVTSRGTDGQQHVEDYDTIIAACGVFTQPLPPDVPGIDDFKGLAVHTAHWTPDIDLKGKRVIQIGTGASGVQVGPAIMDEVEHLTVFQRTPPFVMVNPDRVAELPTPDSFRWGLRHIPHLAQWMRFYTYWWASDGPHGLIVVDPDWPESPTSVNAMSEAWYQMFMGLLRQKMASRPDVLEKIIPNYPIMGKRVLQDSKWTDMLLRENVELVTEPIERLVEDGVVTKDGKHYPADAIIFATGYKISAILQNINLVGRDGVNLRDLWGEEDPRSYMGTTVPGFPNLFVFLGPNSAPTHGAGVNIYSEIQTHYTLACLDEMIARGAKTIEPSKEAHDAYNEKVDAALVNTVWNHPNVTTYYRNSKGRNFLSCPWRIVDVWHMMRQPKIEDFVFD